MLLSIAILLGIGMILNIVETEGNYNMLMAASLCIALYGLNLVVFIVTLCILVVIGIAYAVHNM